LWTLALYERHNFSISGGQKLKADVGGLVSHCALGRAPPF